MNVNENLMGLLNNLYDRKNCMPYIFDGSEFVNTHRSFKIIEDIPRFVFNDEYVKSFTLQWNTFTEVQLDSKTNYESSKDSFYKKTGIPIEDFKGKLVLDVGVGAGRYADLVTEWGANLVGIDLSQSVDAAKKNLLGKNNFLPIQADINDLPFENSTFDIIYSIGVLHHTPNTKDYFLKLVPLLKPGGTIAIWVYPTEAIYIQRKKWIPIVNKIPYSAYYEWCKWFIPKMESYRGSNFFEYVKSVFPFSDQPYGTQLNILDTFDGFSPKFHHIHSPEEVYGWFVEAGLTDIFEPGWITSIAGRKPIFLNHN